MNTIANLDLQQEDNIFVAQLSGEIDLSNATSLREKLVGSIPNSAVGLIIDLEHIQYLDSSGIHLLFDLAARLQKRQQQLRVILPKHQPVRQVLEMVGLHYIMQVHGSVSEALEQMR